MTTITAVRTALAAQISAQVAGLRAIATVPPQVSPPAAVVRPARDSVIEYKMTFDGAADMFFEVVLLVATGSDRTGQADLDAYLSPTSSSSVYLAVQADPTLGGVVASAEVVRAQGYGYIEWGGVEFLGSTLLVEVMSP